jgi:hypothetical protein
MRRTESETIGEGPFDHISRMVSSPVVALHRQARRSGLISD